MLVQVPRALLLRFALECPRALQIYLQKVSWWERLRSGIMPYCICYWDQRLHEARWCASCASVLGHTGRSLYRCTACRRRAAAPMVMTSAAGVATWRRSYRAIPVATSISSPGPREQHPVLSYLLTAAGYWAPVACGAFRPLRLPGYASLRPSASPSAAASDRHPDLASLLPAQPTAAPECWLN